MAECQICLQKLEEGSPLMKMQSLVYHQCELNQESVPRKISIVNSVYGSQQPGCILCHKLVIFCFSLSHFSDLFWNVTMIRTCVSFDNFAARVLILHQFSLQNFPKSQQEPKTYQKLLRTLADSGWLWLTLADSGWHLMTLADTGWLWLSARVS